MAKDFRIYNEGDNFRTKVLEKDSATVLRAGTLIALDAGGLAVEADATSTAVAYTEAGALADTTEVSVITDSTLVLSGTADEAFAKTNRGTEVDVVINSSKQEIDLGASVTDVLKVLPSEDAGVVGELTEVKVVINKTL